MQRYRTMIADNIRWDGFVFRDDDIVISTPPKCGTTWTQMICALLILQDPHLPCPLTDLSPWLDVQTARLDDVTALLDAQTHRRFIKTHTPLDGLPVDERVTYIGVARDPRDAWISWDNHMQNLNLPVVVQARIDAVGLEGIDDLLAGRLPDIPEAAQDRFWLWADDGAPLEESLGNLHGLLHHVTTFWDHRTDGNVVLLHYSDMQADLEGEMRRLASRLGIEVAEDLWPLLVEAATFDEMRAHADTLAPQVKIPGFWNDTGNFFHNGSSGQWRDLLDDAGLVRYQQRVAALAAPDVVAWAHGGSAADGSAMR
jgi:hypothetical protein